MNMMLLTGLSVALALSVMTSNNFYADKVTTASINQSNYQVESEMSDLIKSLKQEKPNITLNNGAISNNSPTGSLGSSSPAESSKPR